MQEKITYREVSDILYPPPASSVQEPKDTAPVEVKKAPYIEFEYHDEGQNASCLSIATIWENMTNELFEELGVP